MTDEMRRVKVEVKFDLFRAVQRLQVDKGERYTYAVISERSGIPENTVQRLMNDEMQRVDNRTLGRLIGFFRSEGKRDFGLQDLYIVEEVAEAA